MLNFITLQGNLTADPVLMKTKAGVSVVNARIACRREEPRHHQDADFIPLTFWGNQADYVCENYKKGNNITVIGRLESNSRVNGDGRRYNTYSVRVAQIANPDTAGALQNAVAVNIE